ncbi:KDEL-tailed cysteine endopeptidase CEP3, partial [Fragariocoptes setiger]
VQANASQGKSATASVQIKTKKIECVKTQPHLLDWVQFKAHYGKTYTSEVEEQHRHALFNARLMSIVRHNLQGSTDDFMLTTTYYTDYSDVELLQMHSNYDKIDEMMVNNDERHTLRLAHANKDDETTTSMVRQHVMLRRRDKRDTRNVKESTNGRIVTSNNNCTADDSLIQFDVDWRESGCFQHAPKSQGSCGACYAFAGAAYLSYLECMSHKCLSASTTTTESRQQLSFSEQYIIDCGPRTFFRGCRGGNLFGFFELLSNHGIVESEHYFNYSEQQSQQCRVAHDYVHKLWPRIAEWQFEMEPNEEWIEKTLAQQPILLSVSVAQDFEFYSGGVMRVPRVAATTSNGEQYRHAALLVGSGQSSQQHSRHNSSSNAFWLLRNSFGADWGEFGGYFRLHKDDAQFGAALTFKLDFHTTPSEQQATISSRDNDTRR